MKNIFERRYRYRLYIYIMLKIVESITVLIPTYLYMILIKKVIENQKSEYLIVIIALYMGVYIFQTGIIILRQRVYNNIFPEIELNYKMKLMKKYDDLDIDILQKYTSGELQERMIGDVLNVTTYLEKKIDVMIVSGSILIYTILLFGLNWIMALIGFLALPLSFYITKKIRERTNIEYEKKRILQGEYNDFMIQNLFFWKEIKSNMMEGRQKNQFKIYWGKMGSTFVKSHIYWFMNRTFIAFKDIFMTKMGLYLLGGILIIYEITTVPILLAFMEYYSGYIEKIMMLLDTLVKFGEQEESIKKIQEILDIPVKSTTTSFTNFQNLALKNITFSYGNKMIFENFSAEINSGKFIAIMGESGCGKSTLVKLIAGYIRPQSGQILWNMNNMEEINRKTLYEKVGFLMQDSRLFNLSIYENLKFGNVHAEEKDMIKACKSANILEFIEKLPNGFATVIGENGICISGGQKKRLQIARLILQDPEVIIFDEATSALDYENEREILEVLLRNMIKKTVIMVTHRKTCIGQCDDIIYIKKKY